MSFLVRCPRSMVVHHLCLREHLRQETPASPPSMFAGRKAKSSGTPMGSAVQQWRLDYKVVTTATDVSYVKAEIAYAIAASQGGRGV
jgi:hypothetical protein